MKLHRVEPIDAELEELMTDFIEKLEDEDYVFYQEGRKKPWRRRTQDLCARINKRIRESEAIKKRPNYKYSSHMFRKTRAFNLFHKGVAELKEKARAAIGQSQNSTAIDSYL